ncbi:hypothetical protein [Rhodoferax sp. GW822-FHT02A01]|uniref:hypothetical protein n=1 Tax=Rhodoferax sp. GW822-FHT02A01 TaxID=3141537 RepID=UPI00315CC3CD
MAYRIVEISTIQDFLSVPSEDLGACLKAFQAHIEKVKLEMTDARHLGASQVTAMRCFTWQRRSTDRSTERPVVVTGSTALRDLGVKPAAVFRLRELNIYCLEDCSEVSQDELMATPDIGHKTVLSIRESLNAIGMDFKEHPNPRRAANNRARLLRNVPLSERGKSINATSEIAQLGLTTSTFSRFSRSNINTVGQLLDLRVSDLSSMFGSSGLREITQTLDALGLTLKANPSMLEQWRYGLRTKEDMPLPSDRAPITELRPWIGSSADAYKRHGLDTVEDLKHFFTDRNERVRGVGAYTLRRTIDFLAAHYGITNFAHHP